MEVEVGFRKATEDRRVKEKG